MATCAARSGAPAITTTAAGAATAAGDLARLPRGGQALRVLRLEVRLAQLFNPRTDLEVGVVEDLGGQRPA